MISNLPNPELPRYDQSTFYGRVQHFIRLTSPLSLLATDQQLQEAQETLTSWRTCYQLQHSAHNNMKRWLPGGKKQDCQATSSKSEEDLWEAKYLVDATLHPDTGEKVLLPFRMASFVPTNLLVTAGLLIPNPSARTVVFMQWLNQSVNVGFNWANANKTTPMSTEEAALAYGTAVTASVSVALGLNRWVQNTRMFRFRTRELVARFVPFVAVATAGSLNVMLMRRKELAEGIDVRDEDGTLVGKSKVAGWLAVSQVAVSRIATALPCLTIPPLVLSFLERKPWFRATPGLPTAVNFGIPVYALSHPLVRMRKWIGLITISLMTALPCAIALFPQQGSFSVGDQVAQYEPWLRDLRRKNGDPVRSLTYNKGL